MSLTAWQRRSSSLKCGARFTQDPSKNNAQKLGDRNSRIPLPRSTSQSCLSNANAEPGSLVRSKSTLGPNYTPQIKSTPQTQAYTPICVSSNKKGTLPKDNRNLQDKEYQMKAQRNVVEYFRMEYNSNLKPNDIKPPTTKLFIELLNHLFEQLKLYNKDELIQFSTSNYEKDLPHWMTGLKYPINTNKSWLKTVNVPQCFPHVIGMLSWLVSFVQVTNMYELDRILSYGINQGWWAKYTVMHFKGCLKAHYRSQLDEGESADISDIVMEVIKIAEETFGVTDDVIDGLENEIKELRSKIEDKNLQAEKEKRDELEQRVTVARAQSIRNTEIINQKLLNIEDMKSKLSKKERNIIELRAEIEKKKLQNEQLERRVKSQAMSHTEFVYFENKCKFLSKEISYVDKECKDNESFIRKYEEDITIKKDKILQQKSKFNRNVLHLEQHVPDLKGCRARMNPDSTEVKEEVENLVEALSQIRAGFVTKMSDLARLRSEKSCAHESLKQRLQEAIASENSILERITIKKCQIEQMKINLTEKVNSMKEEYEELRKTLKIHEQKKLEYENKKLEAAELEKRMAIAAEAEETAKQMIEEKWAQLFEKARDVKAQLAQMRNQVCDQEEEIESWIRNLRDGSKI